MAMNLSQMLFHILIYSYKQKLSLIVIHKLCFPSVFWEWCHPPKCCCSWAEEVNPGFPAFPRCTQQGCECCHAHQDSDSDLYRSERSTTLHKFFPEHWGLPVVSQKWWEATWKPSKHQPLEWEHGIPETGIPTASSQILQPKGALCVRWQVSAKGWRRKELLQLQQ